MNANTRRPLAALIVAAILSIAAMIAPGMAHAQWIPCTTLTITNNIPGCTLQVTFYNSAGSTFTITGITPGTGVYTAPGSTHFNPIGIVTAKGNRVPWTGDCNTCFTLGTSCGPTCATLCPGSNCDMTINPVSPCPTNCN